MPNMTIGKKHKRAEWVQMSFFICDGVWVAPPLIWEWVGSGVSQILPELSWWHCAANMAVCSHINFDLLHLCWKSSPKNTLQQFTCAKNHSWEKPHISRNNKFLSPHLKTMSIYFCACQKTNPLCILCILLSFSFHYAKANNCVYCWTWILSSLYT